MDLLGFVIAKEYIMYLAIIFFGAIVNATTMFQLSRKDETVSYDWIDYVIIIPICLFSGVIFGLIASFQFDNQNVLLAAAGLGSFLGIKGLGKISEVLLGILTKGSKK